MYDPFGAVRRGCSRAAACLGVSEMVLCVD
jgi:hypothetical protein